jgi:hypothetical protein
MSALQLVRNVMFCKSVAAMLIVTQPMGTHMAARRTVKRTITVITTTWTIRWWNGEMWVKQTLGPNIAVVFGGDETSSPDAPASDVAPVSHERSSEFETDQQHTHNESKP